MTNKRERISGVDTAWLRMEHPTNLMMIVGVMMLEGRLNVRDVKRIIGARFLAYPRFGCRAATDAAGAWWESVGKVDLDQHIRRVRLPVAARHPKRG